MAMNLFSQDIRLWQTPTDITYMCMSLNEYGEPDGGMEGVRRRYAHWVRGSLNGVWKTKSELESAKKAVKEHLEELASIQNPTFEII